MTASEPVFYENFHNILLGLVQLCSNLFDALKSLVTFSNTFQLEYEFCFTEAKTKKIRAGPESYMLLPAVNIANSMWHNCVM